MGAIHSFDPTGPLNHLFINKCLFISNEISIGIFEDVFEEPNNIKIEYYSNEAGTLESFVSEYKKLSLKPGDESEVDHDTYDGSCWSFSITKAEFLKDVKKIIAPFISNYVKVMKNLSLIE